MDSVLRNLKGIGNGLVRLFASHSLTDKLPVGHIHARNGFQYEDVSQEYRYQQELEKAKKAGLPFPWSEESLVLFNGEMFLSPIGMIKLLKKYGGGGVFSSEYVKKLIQAIRMSGESKQPTLLVTNTLEYTQKELKLEVKYSHNFGPRNKL